MVSWGWPMKTISMIFTPGIKWCLVIILITDLSRDASPMTRPESTMVSSIANPWQSTTRTILERNLHWGHTQRDQHHHWNHIRRISVLPRQRQRQSEGVVLAASCMGHLLHPNERSPGRCRPPRDVAKTKGVRIFSRKTAMMTIGTRCDAARPIQKGIDGSTSNKAGVAYHRRPRATSYHPRSGGVVPSDPHAHKTMCRRWNPPLIPKVTAPCQDLRGRALEKQWMFVVIAQWYSPVRMLPHTREARMGGYHTSC